MYVILYLWIYIVYTCLFIYHISDYLISFLWLGNTWEILGHPLWLPRSCSPNESHPVAGRSSVSAYLKDWNTSVIGIGSPAHKLNEFRNKFRDKHGQTHAIRMPSQCIIPCHGSNHPCHGMPRLKLGHRMSAAVPNLAPSLSWQDGLDEVGLQFRSVGLV